MITGEQIRTRRFARPIAFAIRCESASPKPGQNHGPHLDPVDLHRPRLDLARASTIPAAQSCSKSSVKAWASSGESTTAITFSSRDHESSVQFVEPVQTEVTVADDVLVVHQVGDARRSPSSARASRSTSSGASFGGGGTGIGARKSAL